MLEFLNTSGFQSSGASIATLVTYAWPILSSRDRQLLALLQQPETSGWISSRYLQRISRPCVEEVVKTSLDFILRGKEMLLACYFQQSLNASPPGELACDSSSTKKTSQPVLENNVTTLTSLTLSPFTFDLQLRLLISHFRVQVSLGWNRFSEQDNKILVSWQFSCENPLLEQQQQEVGMKVRVPLGTQFLGAGFYWTRIYRLWVSEGRKSLEETATQLSSQEMLALKSEFYSLKEAGMQVGRQKVKGKVYCPCTFWLELKLLSSQVQSRILDWPSQSVRYLSYWGFLQAST